MLVDDHVATHLADIETVIPDLDQADRLVCNDVEYEDVKRMVANIGQRPLQPSLVTVDPLADVVSHQEPQQGWNW